MTIYSQLTNKKITPVNLPIPGSSQVKNNGGGYSYKISPLDQLKRFLILGTEKGTYYASEKDHTINNIECLSDCINTDPKGTVDLIVNISTNGRAPKNDPAIFALALCSSSDNQVTREYSYEALSKVCRTGTHLFQYIEAINGMRGWGNSLKRAVGNWYTSKDPDTLAYGVTKYNSRNGWSHKDVMRLAHPKSDNPYIQGIFRYICEEKITEGSRSVVKTTKGKEKTFIYEAVNYPDYLKAVEEVKACKDSKRICKLIEIHNIPREIIPTEYLNDAKIWEALLFANGGMSTTAMLRNLNKMTELGILGALSYGEKLVCDTFTSAEMLKKGKIHPLQIIVAQKQYNSGISKNLRWIPNPRISAALEDGFIKAFDVVQPTGKRFQIALDVSGSMNAAVSTLGLSAKEVSALMALVTIKTEPYCLVTGFSHSLIEIDITRQDTIASTLKKISRIPFEATDCSLPWTYAKNKNLNVDVCMIITDNECNGGIHQSQALKEYRKHSGINAYSIIMGVTSTGFSIADPQDPRSLDIVGCDTAVPSLINEFVSN